MIPERILIQTGMLHERSCIDTWVGDDLLIYLLANLMIKDIFSRYPAVSPDDIISDPEENSAVLGE